MSAEELNQALKGHEFALFCSDPRCPTGRVRWLGFTASLGKAGVAGINFDGKPGKSFVVAVDLLRSLTVEAPTEQQQRVALDLFRLQQLMRKSDTASKTSEDEDAGYTQNYDVRI